MTFLYPYPKFQVSPNLEDLLKSISIDIFKNWNIHLHLTQIKRYNYTIDIKARIKF